MMPTSGYIPFRRNHTERITNMSRTASKKIANRYGLDTKIYEYTGLTPSGSPLLTVDFANITDIELTSDVIWATGNRNHDPQVPFDEPYQGSFTLQTQCVPLQLIALITNDTTVNTDTGTVHFKNDVNGTASPKFYVLVSDTVWKDDNGAILNETMTAFKVRPRKNYSASYSGTGDPQSVSIVFDMVGDPAGNVLDLTRAEPST